MIRLLKVLYYILTTTGILIGIAVGYNQLRIWQHNGQSYMSELLRIALIFVFAACILGGGLAHYFAHRLSRKQQLNVRNETGNAGLRSENERLREDYQVLNKHFQELSKKFNEAVFRIGQLTTKPQSKLVIHAADYRAWDSGGETFDVTAFMRRIVVGDTLVFGPIENHTFAVGGENFVPRDPLFGKPKRLRVKYSYSGEQERIIERPEHGRLVLPEDSEIERLTEENTQLKQKGQLSRDRIDRIELAGVIKSKAGHAEWLANDLERIWHLFNNANQKLIYPLRENVIPDPVKEFWDKELWAFRIRYRSHVGGTKFHVPDFRDDIMDHPDFWNVEYLVLRRKLTEHAEALRKLAQSLEAGGPPKPIS